MAGKYAHVIDKLPKLLNTEPKFQEKVLAVKEAILAEVQTLSAADLAKRYIDTRTKIEGIEQVLSEFNLELEAISQLMSDQFDEQDLTSMNIRGMGSVRQQHEPYAQVRDKEAFRKWCIANGLEQSLALPWPSTNSIVKERLLAGQPEPDGITVFVKSKFVLTREKG